MMKKLSTEYILRRLGALGVSAFTTEEFRRLFRLDAPQAYRALHRLAARGVVRRLRHGGYVVVGLGESEALGQPLFLGTRLVEPSYVAFWSALHFYGWTEQAPRVTFVANTRRSGTRRVGHHRFRLVRLAPARFFGYASARQGALDFPVAEPEKAIVDAFYLPDLCGGVELAAAAAGEAVAAIDLERLEAYAARMGVRTLCSRLGYVLETLGAEPRSLRRCAATSFVKLDPHGPRRGRFVARWNVIDNRRGP